MMGWQSHQLDHMQIICTSLQTDNHTSTSSLSFYRLDALPCRPTNSVKSLKAQCLLMFDNKQWVKTQFATVYGTASSTGSSG